MKEEAYNPEIIDRPKWDEAGWKGLGYAFDRFGEEPPIFGPVFGNQSMGTAIFKDWRRRFGEVDEFEQLRVVIVEGKIPKEPAGYSVLIGAEPENILHQVRKQDCSVDPRYVVAESRVFREETPESQHLSHFKKQYGQYKEYKFAPFHLRGEQPVPDIKSSITKNKIFFRDAADISDTEPDSAVFARSKLYPNQN